VGLGNPGSEYEQSRHNAGFMAVDRLIHRHAPDQRAKGRFHAAVVEASIPTKDDADAPPVKALLLKPIVYMNRSGVSVSEAVRFYKLDPAADLLVLVDDVALPVGSIRVRTRGGAGGHNGLADIEQRLGTDAYARCRIGVGSPPDGSVQRDYVLARFSPEQREQVEPALDRAADAAELWATAGAEAAMNRFNQRAAAEPSTPEPASTSQHLEEKNSNHE